MREQLRGKVNLRQQRNVQLDPFNTRSKTIALKIYACSVNSDADVKTLIKSGDGIVALN